MGMVSFKVYRCRGCTAWSHRDRHKALLLSDYCVIPGVSKIGSKGLTFDCGHPISENQGSLNVVLQSDTYVCQRNTADFGIGVSYDVKASFVHHASEDDQWNCIN